ncbi:hypothetical protein [Pantoea vagans]|uniref:hypothetical protein n=1 Tax=Pantoea vagans TaxID=470934 RepID=UPI00366DD7F9
MSEEKQYAERDLMAMDIAGNHYCRHVDHMTREKLHSKSDIAAELGWRDMQIAELKAQRDALAENEGYKQAFYEMAEILGIGARADSPKNVFEQVMKPALISLKKESVDMAELGSVFDELAKAIGWSKERCEQTGESPIDVAVASMNLITELEKDVYPKTDEWAIDKTCGRPILVYKGCSVIEAEDAAYILNLVREDKLRAGEPS